MKKLNRPKLQLTTETIRTLTSDQLNGVKGGMFTAPPSTNVSRGQTAGCPLTGE